MSRFPTISLPRLARVLSVLAIAMAAGHLAQTLAARKPAPVVVAEAPDAVNIVQLSATSLPLADPAPEVPVLPVSEVAPLAEVQEPPELVPVQQVADPCLTLLGLRPAADGMIDLTLTAPCRKEERVVLRHEGLAFTGRVGADGSLTATLPAFVAEAEVEARFADGVTLRDWVDAPEAAGLRRFGVQWQGAEGFILHGLENGADFGQAGDIHAANPEGATGGHMAVMGDSSVENPLLAQVYTFPKGEGQSAEVVIEAAVTEATCNGDLIGETLSAAEGRVEVTDLTLAMPDCSAAGDFLVLKNLAPSMKIAAN